MRVLGCVHNWYKLVFLVIFLGAFNSNASSNESITISSYKDLLKLSKEQGTEYKKLKAQFEIDELNADSLVSLYNWSVSGGLTKEDAESPSTSPFAPAGESSRESFNFRVDKKTAFGIDPYVELSTDDQALNFPGGASIDFQTANLEVGLRADLMKLLFAKSSSAVFKEYGLKKEVAKLALESFERVFFGEVSKLYFQALKSHKRLQILKTQCGQYDRLQKISSNRYRKRLIREKDYLSIEVLQQGCLLDKDFAKNTFEMDKLTLLKKTGLSLQSEVKFEDSEFLKPSPSSDFALSKNLDYILAEKTLEARRAYSESKKSGFMPELSFDYSLSSQSSEDGMGSSVDETFGFDLLTHNIGLNLKYEFGSSAAKIEAKKAEAETLLYSLELKELQQSLVRDDKKLKTQAVFLKSANVKSLKLVSLQKRKADLFRKDFENGKGGIRDLVEAQVNYLQSLETSLNYKYSQAISQIDRYLMSGEGLEGTY